MAKSQIIKDLANGSIDTQTALKRTKVLLQEFDDERLLEWVNYEIEGYPNDVEVPEYRRISGQSFCSYIKGTMLRFLKYSNVPLSLGNMPENEREIFYYANMRESVGALKGTIHEYEKKGTSIGRIIPAEYYPYIAKCNNDMGMVIQSAEIQLNMPQILIFSRKLKTSYWIFCAILKNNLGIWMS